jgi:hypothetical protein
MADIPTYDDPLSNMASWVRGVLSNTLEVKNEDPVMKARKIAKTNELAKKDILAKKMSDNQMSPRPPLNQTPEERSNWVKSVLNSSNPVIRSEGKLIPESREKLKQIAGGSQQVNTAMETVKNFMGIPRKGMANMSGALEAPTPIPTPTPTPEPVERHIDIHRLVGPESSGNPYAIARGSDGKTYEGLTQMGVDAWEEVNNIRRKEGKKIYSYREGKNNPAASIEYGDTYLNVRVPELLEADALPVNPLMMLIQYGGWRDSWSKANGDINKMKSSEKALRYFNNVLGKEVVDKYRDSVLLKNIHNRIKEINPSLYANLAKAGKIINK